jgi:predicted GNAT family acetyltransferase
MLRRVKLTVYADPPSFERAAREFLAAREAENNLLLGVTAQLIEQADRFGGEPYLATVHDGAGRMALAALRTPPHNLVISAATDPSALAALAMDAERRMGSLPGVLGPSVTARAFAAVWQRATGEGPTAERAERIYELTAVVPPRAAPGRLERATWAHRDLLIDWMDRFNLEALGESERDRGRTELAIDRRLTSLTSAMHLWIDGGPVCMAGSAGPTPTGIRVGPVYTPPQFRRRGYASACVAALSQALLDSGRQRCFLFTDLANPTSNAIYRALGYRPVCDMASISLGRPVSSPPSPG